MTTTIGGSYPAVNSDSDATINGLTVGKGGGAVVSNSAFGQGALNNAGTGNYNTAIGFDTLYSNTTGSGGTAVGGYALYSNTTGTANTGIGGFVSTGSIQPALFNNTTGSYNIAVGTGALASNIAGNNNTALGYRSLYNYTASGSTAIGYNSGYSMTSGFISAAVGHSSLYSNTTGASCVAVGYNSLYANTTGSYNVAVGEQALQSNTTASNSTAVGYQAGYNSTGSANTCLGYQAGIGATGSFSGSNNTLIGQQAGYALTTGSNNTFVGPSSQNAGSNVTTGSNNTIIGGYGGNSGGLDIRTASGYIVLSDGSGNPRGFCNGTQWYFGNQTASSYWPQASSVSGQNCVSIDRNNANIGITSNDASPIYINRNTSDGDLIRFYTTGTQQGNISVSGSTVSYNGGHLSRWSQLLDNSKDDTILKGTVMSNLDNMCVWEKDGVVADNEQLNKMKVSDLEGDINIAGVFVNWSMDEQYGVDDMNIAMTGDMIIRIAQGVVVAKGDLLMSAGDGTAKPQGDDIRKSKTVAKVTSNHITCTYADGSYCVPCVLMAC